MKAPTKSRYAPRRRILKRTYVPRPIRSNRLMRQYMSGRTLRITKKLVGSLLNIPGSSTYLNSTYWLAQDCPDWASIINLFDEYRIVSIKASFMSLANSANVSSASGAAPTSNQLGFICTCIDDNDNSAPGSVNAIMEYDNAKLTRSDQTFHTRVVYPKVANTVYRPGVSAAYADGGNPWIPTAYGDVPHYGMKFAIVAPLGDPLLFNYSVTPITEYVLELRNPH